MFEPLRTAFDALQAAYDRAVAARGDSSREKRRDLINALRAAQANVERLCEEAKAPEFMQRVRDAFQPHPDPAARFDAASSWGAPPPGGFTRRPTSTFRNLTLRDFRKES